MGMTMSNDLLEQGYVKISPVELSTLGGMVEIEYLNMRGTEIRVNMGKVSFASGKKPVTGDRHEIINESMVFHDRLYNTTCVSVGNPHCVIMMEKVTKEDTMEINPHVEYSPNAPQRTHTQLCRVIDRNNVEIEIYERDAGYTLASGTSACAAAAAAYKMGLTDDTVSVHMPEGILDIKINHDHTVSMVGSV